MADWFAKSFPSGQWTWWYVPAYVVFLAGLIMFCKVLNWRERRKKAKEL